MGPIGCPETSVTNHGYMLRNIPEERKSISVATSAVFTVKGKVTPLQAQLWPEWGRGIVLRFQDLGARKG
jgi:hypothetical protein